MSATKNTSLRHFARNAGSVRLVSVAGATFALASLFYVSLSCVTLCNFSLGVSTAYAQDPVVTVEEDTWTSKNARMIQNNAAAFVKAFNAGDAKAVAHFWAEDGDYVDQNGQHFLGRDAIEQEYSRMLAERSGAKMTLSIESIKFATETVAIEDGIARIEAAPYVAPSSSHYTVVHILKGGRWLMSSVRDMRVDLAPTQNSLQELAWLIGRWKVSGDEQTSVVTEFNWIAGKNYIRRDFTATRGDVSEASGTQIIGVDPASGQIQSWSFDSSGGRSEAIWHRSADGWVIEAKGTLKDGTPTSSRNQITIESKDSFSWHSTSRFLKETSLPDADAIEIIRIKSAR